MTCTWCTCGHEYSEHDAQGRCLMLVRKRPCKCQGFSKSDQPPSLRVDATHISNLLAAHHAEDVFVPECKNGPTQSVREKLRIFDAWVMLKSWSHWGTVGYEIKVSRSDFNQDQKWLEYLPYCHLFYFVCPGGLIRSTDLPPGIGLMWVSQNGSKLHTKVHAHRHEPDPAKLIELMSYVLMRKQDESRLHDFQQSKGDRMAALRHEVEQANERKALAQFVHEHIRQRIHEAQNKLSEAQTFRTDADEIMKHLELLGIRWDPEAYHWQERTRVKHEIDALTGAISDETLDQLKRAVDTINRAIGKVHELRAQKDYAAVVHKGE
jgi:hypothetical protein